MQEAELLVGAIALGECLRGFEEGIERPIARIPLLARIRQTCVLECRPVVVDAVRLAILRQSEDLAVDLESLLGRRIEVVPVDIGVRGDELVERQQRPARTQLRGGEVAHTHGVRRVAACDLE